MMIGPQLPMEGRAASGGLSGAAPGTIGVLEAPCKSPRRAACNQCGVSTGRADRDATSDAGCARPFSSFVT